MRQLELEVTRLEYGFSIILTKAFRFKLLRRLQLSRRERMNFNVYRKI